MAKYKYQTRSGLRVEMLDGESPISGYPRAAIIHENNGVTHRVAYTNSGVCCFCSPRWNLSELK